MDSMVNELRCLLAGVDLFEFEILFSEQFDAGFHCFRVEQLAAVNAYFLQSYVDAEAWSVGAVR